jgi:hypothetical protein
VVYLLCACVNRQKQQAYSKRNMLFHRYSLIFLLSGYQAFSGNRKL